MGKYVFFWEELNFEHIGNSVYTTEFLALGGKALNIYINCSMISPSRQHVKWKHLNIQVYIQQWFHDEQEAKFM